MLKEDWAVLIENKNYRRKKMGQSINWLDERNPYKKVKNYLDTDSEVPGWRTILNTKNIKCDACTRRIKIGQTILWHIETKAKMHLPQECKMW
jgi:hypothetical protein